MLSGLKKKVGVRGVRKGFSDKIKNLEVIHFLFIRNVAF
jgi:hypothetical protein